MLGLMQPVPLALPQVFHRAEQQFPMKAIVSVEAGITHRTTVAEWALGYQWDIVLDGPGATPPDPDEV